MNNFSRKKIILLNPPSETIIQRDHYCTLTSKTEYFWSPIDLLVHSGELSKFHDVLIIDAIAEKLSSDFVSAKICTFKPDFVLTLSSILSVKVDLEFLQKCRDKIFFNNILLGDVFYFNYNVLINHPIVDAILLQYPASGLLQYIEGLNKCDDIIYKKNNIIVKGDFCKGDVFMTTPAHQLFPLSKYKVPLMKKWPFVPVLTSLSCPMTCSYCPVQGISSRERPIADLIIELDLIKELAIPEILLADLMFNGNILRAKKICQVMIEKNYKFSWFALMRPDKFDEELLNLMKKAGCHTISFGIETTDTQILKNNSRTMNLEKTKKSFSVCNKLGIQTLAIILIGLPGETKNSIQSTINFVTSLPAHYLSVNLFAPRNGSKYMTPLNNLDELRLDYNYLDSTTTNISYCDLSIQEIQMARKNALRRFYLNPSRIFRVLSSIKTFVELKTIFLNGIELLFRY